MEQGKQWINCIQIIQQYVKNSKKLNKRLLSDLYKKCMKPYNK